MTSTSSPCATPLEGRFHESLSAVRAPVTYLTADSLKASAFWSLLHEAAAELPGLWSALQRFSGAAESDIVQAIELARTARQERITHLHAHFASVATTVTRIAAAIAGVPFTFTAHAKDIFHESVDELDLRAKLESAAATVTVSRFNVAYLTERFGASADGVRYVANGLDLDRFPFEPHAVGGHATDEPPVIAAVGRLVEKKGFGDLIDACGLLTEQGHAFRCVIAGTGPLEGQLRARIAARKLEDRVRLVGALAQHQVIELVRSATVFAAPCVVGSDGNRDGLPTVLLEAMALGTACVATDVTGIPELIRDLDTGLIVREGDIAGLAGALGKLLDDAALRTRLSQRARAVIESEYEIHRQTTELRAMFRAARTAERMVAA